MTEDVKKAITDAKSQPRRSVAATNAFINNLPPACSSVDHGIDYGKGTTNIDMETGIRYGVISMNDLHDFAHESFEDDYGEPTCPKCGNVVVNWDCEKHNEYEDDGSDFACETCKHSYESEAVYGDERLGSHLNDGEYVAEENSDGDVFVLHSKFYTYAKFCSPCAPGACHLSNPTDTDGPRAYCFGHEWFEDGIAPYDVYEVASGKLLTPEDYKAESDMKSEPLC